MTLIWNVEQEFKVRFALGELQDLKNILEILWISWNEKFPRGDELMSRLHWMPFHSITFILAFLPLVVAAYAVLGPASPILGKVWLICASLVFYAWSGPTAVPALVRQLHSTTGFPSDWTRIALSARDGSI